MKRPKAQLTVTNRDASRYRELRNRLGYVPLRADRREDALAGREVKAWDWFRITNSAGDGGEPAVVHLYDEIGWYGVTAADFVAQLEGITASEIELRVNSPGGDVYDGIAIYSAIIDHPAQVAVKVDALAASAASFIIQGGDTIEMGRNSELMIHDAWGMAIGNAADMREMAGLLDKASDNIASIYAARASNGGTATWRKRMEGEAWYSASESVEIGLADTVAKTEKRRGSAAPEDRVERRKYANRSAAPAPQLKAEDDDEPQAKVCPECEAEVSDDATECPECGADLGAETEETEDALVLAEVDPWAAIDWDAIEFPTTAALHLAILDGADSAELGVNTEPLRALVLGEDWQLDGDALCATILDAVREFESRPPEPEPEPIPDPPRHAVPIADVADALRRAVS